MSQDHEYGFVYKWTNKKNGKWYIGSHLGTPDDKYVASGKIFNRAIRRYGIDSFSREILYQGKDFRTTESEYLRKLQAAKDPMSYNLTDAAIGGAMWGKVNGMFGKKLSEEHKKALYPKWTKERADKHSERMRGAKNPLFGKGHTPEAIAKMSETKQMKKKNFGFLGSGYTHQHYFKRIYRNLLGQGKEVSPRGQKVLEIENYNYVLPPYVRFVNFTSRNLKLNYIKREFLWYLKGDPKDLSIVQYAKLWESTVTKKKTINSNYGQYIFGEDGQFDYVINTLKADKDSRRASMMILSKEHILSGDSDLPCTYSMNFRIRENKLNMTVRMRSQDAVFGMGSDVPCFSFIHEMVSCSLKEHYPELEYGDYCHSADSFHVYERHFELLNKIVYGMKIDGRTKYESYKLIYCPKISGREEVEFLRACKFDLIPPKFEFTTWLNSFEDERRMKYRLK